MDKGKRKERYSHGDYVCPRCNYHTPYKQHIEKHFARKKPCPCEDPDNQIILTDAIKNHVIENRRYVPKKKEEKPAKQSQEKSLNIQINNYNQMNSFVTRMDHIEKVQKYIDWMNTNNGNKTYSIQSYKEKIENELYDAGYDSEYLSHLIDNAGNIEITEHDLDEHKSTIDKVTRMKDTPTNPLGVMYDIKTKKMYLYDEDEWEDLHEKTGIRKLIVHIKDIYWNAYESYLIDRLNKHKNLLARQRAKELLKDYYTFLFAFGIQPEHKEMSEIPQAIWLEASKTKTKIINDIHKEVLNIVKSNNSANMQILNKEIMKLVRQSDTFKNSLLADTSENIEALE